MGEEERVSPINETGSDQPPLQALFDHVANNVGRDKWKNLGVKLLPRLMVDQIAGIHPLNFVECCHCVLEKWWENPNAMWSQLIQALRSPSVQLDALAGELEQMLSTEPVTSKGTEPASEKWTSIKVIDIQFAKMTSRIEQALISNNVDVAKLITQLRAISAVKNREVPLFDDDVFEKIQIVDILWRKLSSFWDIFDYELLECVIETSDCGEAQSIFKNFLSRIDPLEIEDADLVLDCRVQNLKGLLKPVLRIKVNAEECTSKIRKQVKKRVSKAYDLEKYALRFQGIKDGCIELLYYISKPLKSHILKHVISENTAAEFLTDKIISLQIDEFKLKILSNITDTTKKRFTWSECSEEITTLLVDLDPITSTPDVSYEALNLFKQPDKVNTRPLMMDLNQHFIQRYATDWEEIGILLNLPSGTLHSIGLDYRGAIPCCRAMLEKWLQRDTTASWSKLFSVIESRAVVTSVPGKGVDYGGLKLFKQPDIVNTTPSMKDLYVHIMPRYAADWKKIGMLLDLPSAELEAIQVNNPADVRQCCREMLKLWLEMDTTASWRKMFATIESPAVAHSFPDRAT